MGGRIRIITAAGDVFDEDEDEAFQTMSDLEDMGMKFNAVQAPGRSAAPASARPAAQTSGASGVYSAPEGIEPVQAEPDEPPAWLRGLVDQGNRYERSQQLARAPENVAPVVGGLAYGASAHAWDPLQEARQSAPADLQRATDFVGSVASPLNLLGGGAGWAGVGRTMAAQGLQGGMRGYNDADPSASVPEKLMAAVPPAAISAGLAGALGTAGRWLGRGGEAADDVADRARLRSWRLGDDELRAIADRRASQAYSDALAAGMTREQAQAAGLAAGNVDDVAQSIVARGEEMVPPNVLAGRKPGDWSQQFGDKRNELDRAIDGLIGEAQSRGAQLPADPRALVAGNLQQQANAAATSGAGFRGAPALEANAAAVRAGPQTSTPQAVRSAKAAWDAQAYKGGAGTPQAFEGKANLATANEYRGMLRDYVEQGGQDLVQPFANANRDYGIASDLFEAGRGGAVRAQTGGPSLSSGGGGAVNRVLSALPGPSSLPDVAANVSRLAGQGLDDAGDFATNMSRAAPTAATAAVSRTQTPGYSQEQMNDGSRGHNLSRNILNLLNDNRAALGPYADQFGAVSDPDKLEALARRLYQTDVRFARTVWPLINGGNR